MIETMNEIFKIRIKQTLILIFLCVFWVASSYAETSDSLVGKVAPLLSGKKALGSGLLKLTNLMTEISFEKDEKGKFREVKGKYIMQVQKNVVVLNFFATTCIPCIREIPTYNELAEKYKKKPVKLIYVSVDTDVSDQEIGRFIAKRQIKIPMMMPNQKDAIKKYQVYSLPRIVIIDRQRKIAYEVKGFKEDLNYQLSKLIDGLL
jgi:thiol-disulfide isomerase/thioredoxin